MAHKPLVIIGGGMAGYSVLRAFRQLNQERKVILVTEGDGVYYAKPQLSNFLSKRTKLEAFSVISASDMQKKYDCEVFANTHVSLLDIKNRLLKTEKGMVSYGDLVLATGSKPKIFSFLGNAHPKIFQINSLMHYRKFFNSLSNVKRVAVIGSGFVGCEFANDLVLAKYHVDLITPSEYPMCRFIDREVANEFCDRLGMLGINWYFNSSLKRIDLSGGGKRVLITLSNKKMITSDIVLAAIGIAPNAFLAEECGLLTSRGGVVVDSSFRTSDPHVFALGDCAVVSEAWVPFVQPIQQASPIIAKNLNGVCEKLCVDHFQVSLKTPTFPLKFKLPVCARVTV